MTQKGNVKAGDVILFTTGEYSNYSVSGLWRMERDFNLREEWSDWKFRHRDSYYSFYGYGDGKDNFLHHLMVSGLATEVDYTEFHNED